MDIETREKIRKMRKSKGQDELGENLEKEKQRRYKDRRC